jgi:hypothetical protein
MYTDDMRRAFRSIYPPNNFQVDIVDNDHFLSVVAREDVFMRLLDEEKRAAIEYMVNVKKALEMNGAIVMLVREGGKE